MRELLLLRHAKSTWDEAGLDDHARDLAPRGVKAATRIGRFLRKSELLPDLVLCSTAVRAARTHKLVAAEWPDEVETQHLQGLYLASPSQILAIVQRQAETVGRLLVIGHNPGLQSLASQLFAEGDEAGAAAINEKYPTGGLAHYRFEAGSWSEVALGTGELVQFVQPRSL